MAITFNNTRNVSRSSGLYSEFARTSTIKIHSDGKVSCSDNIDLGLLGDHHATCLIFDTTELGVDLAKYEQVLVFLDITTREIVSYSFDCESNTFLVPNVLTSVIEGYKERKYTIFYTLQEKEQESGDYSDLVDTPNSSMHGNITGRTEIFISQGFTGTVSSSFWSSFLTDNTVVWETATTTPVGMTIDSVHKSVVSYSWENGSFKTTLNQVGEFLDSLITPLEFTNFPWGISKNEILPGTYQIYFIFESSSGNLYYKKTLQYSSNTTGQVRILVPREVTNKGVGIWNVGIIYESYDLSDTSILTRRVVCNKLTAEVLGNDLQFSYLAENQTVLSNTSAVLLDSNGEEMPTESGEGPAIATIEVTGNSAVLTYSGAQVEALLGWVNTKQSVVESCISTLNNNIGKWDGYDSRIQTLESLDLIGIDTRLDTIAAVANTARLDSQTAVNKVDNIMQPQVTALNAQVEIVAARQETINSEQETIKTNLNGLTDRVDAHDRAWVTYDDHLTAVRVAITTEQSARIAQDAVLQTAIDSEASSRTVADNQLQEQITTNTTAIQNINTNIENKRFIQWEDTNKINQPLIKQIIFWNGTEEEFLISSAKDQKDILYLLPEEEDES